MCLWSWTLIFYKILNMDIVVWANFSNFIHLMKRVKNLVWGTKTSYLLVTAYYQLLIANAVCQESGIWLTVPQIRLAIRKQDWTILKLKFPGENSKNSLKKIGLTSSGSSRFRHRSGADLSLTKTNQFCFRTCRSRSHLALSSQNSQRAFYAKDFTLLVLKCPLILATVFIRMF